MSLARVYKAEVVTVSPDVTLLELAREGEAIRKTEET